MNICMVNQQIAEAQRATPLNVKIEHLSEEDKNEVKNLLARNHNNNFIAPNSMLNLSQLCKEIV